MPEGDAASGKKNDRGFRVSPGRPGSAGRAAARARHERRLLERIQERCLAVLVEACRYSSVPVAFLMALVANESGGNSRAMRFEPAVYRHLKLLAEGKAAKYGELSRPSLSAEIAEMLQPKSETFHAAHLGDEFAAAHAAEIAAAEDEALRELATSWGYTQIMGYHMVGRAGTVRDLLEPQFHFRVALELLAEFAERYQLNPTREFAEMFRCWNTGQPYGQTTDPAYVEKGRARMEIFRAIGSSGDRVIGPLSH